MIDNTENSRAAPAPAPGLTYHVGAITQTDNSKIVTENLRQSTRLKIGVFEGPVAYNVSGRCVPYRSLQ